MSGVILLVEDDAIEAMDIKLTLESFGYKVPYVASHAEEAIEKAKELKPDLVLIDIILKSKMDGVEAAQKIRKLKIPFIYLTAHSEESMVKKAKLTEPYGYLIKPFDVTELKYAIELALYKSRQEKILKESEERYRNLFNQIKSCVAVYEAIDGGENFIFKDVNPATEKVENIKNEMVVGRKVTDVFPGIKDFGLFEVFQRVYKTGKSEHHPISFYQDNRITGWRDNFVYKLPSGEIVAVYDDVTKYKQLEEEIKESEYKFRSIVETSHEGISISTSDQGFLYVNQRFQELLGYKKEELLGHNILEFLVEDQDMLINEAQKQCQEGMNFEMVLKFRKKDGSTLWTLTKVSPLKDSEGNYYAILAMHSNITKIKRTEEELRKSESYYRTIFENTGAATVIIEKDGTISLANREFEKLSGYKKEELEGIMKWAEFVVPEDLNRMKEYHHIRRIDPLKAPKIYDFRFKDRQGKIKNIQLNVDIIPGTKKSVASLIDITKIKKIEENLSRSLEWLAFAQKASKSGFWDWDIVAEKLTWSQEFYELFGLPQDSKASFETWIQIVHPDDRDAAVEVIEKAIEEHEFLLTDYRIIKPDEGEVWIRALGTTYYDDNNKPLRMSGICLDITERKKMEEKNKELFQDLEKQRSRLQAIIKALPVGLWIANKKGKIIFTNNIACEMWGVKAPCADSISDFDQYKCWQEDTGELITAKNMPLTKALEGEVSENNIINFQRSNGTYGTQIVIATPIKDSEGNIAGALAIAQDITELKEMQRALQESEEKYRLVFECAAEGIVILDRFGKIVEVNDRVLELSGFKREELVGKNFMRIVPKIKMSLGDIFSAFKKIMMGKKLEEKTFTFTNLRGEQVSFIAHYANIKKDGDNKGLSIIMEDITERIKAEKEMKASLREKEVLLREVHHRVKNNMQIISSLLNLQMQSVGEEVALNVLRESQGRIKTMAMIHEKLYHSSSLDEINFKEYVEKLLSDIFYTYGIIEGNIRKDLDIENINLDIDTAIPCGLIINELVTNSVKYAFPHGHGTITTKLRSNDGKIEFIIADDGIGLPEDIDLRKTDTLGLKLVNSLINQIDGQIIMDRSKGTMFRIIINKKINQ